MQVYRLRGVLALTAVVAAAACSDNLTVGQPTAFYANMDAAQEPTLAVASSGTGTATVTVFGTPTGTGKSPGDSVHYTVTYTGLTGAPTAAHIHVGAPGTVGTVRVNLCGTGAPAPACPATAAGTFSGNATVIAGGISMDSLYSALKTTSGTAGAYVNIHTTQNPNGEIRGIVLKNPSGPTP